MDRENEQTVDGCHVCGRFRNLAAPERQRVLRRVDNQMYCFECLCREGSKLRASIGEERVLKLIENWFG